MPIYGNNKLGKTRFLLKQDRISPYIPETLKATKESLRDMLARLSMVYIKPSLGTVGLEL
jgi:hypothetical protein